MENNKYCIFYSIAYWYTYLLGDMFELGRYISSVM